MTGHALISPSSMARTMQCPGSVMLCRKYPGEDTDESLEGHAAHIVARGVAEHGLAYTVGDEIIGSQLRVDQAMIDGAALYATVAGLAYRFEHQISIPLGDLGQCFGTPDAYRIQPDNKRLHIIDYKYGFTPVLAFENWQMVTYAIGLITELAIKGVVIEYLEITIVQPRNYTTRDKVDTWLFPVAMLAPYATLIERNIKNALSASPNYQVGPQCLHCPARGHCSVLQEAATHYFNFQSSGEHDLTPVQIGTELALIRNGQKLLEARESSLAVQAIALIKSGVQVRHFMLDQTLGKFDWISGVSVDEIEAMAQLIKHVTVLKPRELITPTQAKKILPSKVIDQYAERKPGSAKLVSDISTTVKRIFQNE